MDNDNFANAARESLIRISKNGASVLPISEVQHSYLPVPPIYLQHCIGNIGIRTKSLFDIIGADGIGKTSLMFTMFGWFMQQNSPCLYIETEAKMMAPERIVRCLHTDRAMALKMFNAITSAQCFELTQAIETIEAWVATVRDPNSDTFVPLDIPVVVGLDTFSKLMAPKEAAGRMIYSDGSKSEGKVQELVGGSNFGHASIAQKWSRRLPNWLYANNVVLILNRHQNDKVDMSGGMAAAPLMTADAADSINRTSIGGRAFGQNAALQLILTRHKYASVKIRDENVKVGVDAKITVAKNSYGPTGRRCFYRVNQVPRKDTDTYQEPAISFAPYTAEWLEATQLLTMSHKNRNCFSVKELNLFDADTDEVYAAVHSDQSTLSMLGSRLGLGGYAMSDQTPKLVEPTEEEQKESEIPVEEGTEDANVQA